MPWGTGTGLGAQDEGTEARLFVASISKQPVNAGALGFVNFFFADSVAQHEHISIWAEFFKGSCSIYGDIENPNLNFLPMASEQKWL